MRSTKTISEADLRARLEAGERVEDISKSLGYKRSDNLRNAMTVLGVSALAHKRTVASELADFALGLLEQGFGVTDIAKQRNVTRQYVAQSLKNAGYPTTVAKAIRALRERG